MKMPRKNHHVLKRLGRSSGTLRFITKMVVLRIVYGGHNVTSWQASMIRTYHRRGGTYLGAVK